MTLLTQKPFLLVYYRFNMACTQRHNINSSTFFCNAGFQNITFVASCAEIVQSLNMLLVFVVAHFSPVMTVYLSFFYSPTGTVFVVARRSWTPKKWSWLNGERDNKKNKKKKKKKKKKNQRPVHTSSETCGWSEFHFSFQLRSLLTPH